MKGLSIKVTGAIAAVLMALGVSAHIFSESFVEREITAVGDAWTTLESRDAPKMRLIGRLRATLGYGGMIHAFKNYILRGGEQKSAAIRSKINDFGILLDDYDCREIHP